MVIERNKSIIPHSPWRGLTRDSGLSCSCKASNVVYYIECSLCNLLYVGQTSNTLNVRINGRRNDIKNRKNIKVNDFEIKHFQLHDFNKIHRYVAEVVLNLESRLKVESLSMYKLNATYP